VLLEAEQLVLLEAELLAQRQLAPLEQDSQRVLRHQR
jgi:hypothetical protein